jgi:RNA polymerase sporulation-specific sigma factor
MAFAMHARAARWSRRTDEELILTARAGNHGAIEEILRRYRGFVEAKARGYFVCGADRDDVVQEGMIGLFKAIRDYEPDRPVRFRSFADLCITRQIISAVKSAARRKHQPLNQYVPLDGASEDGDVFLVDTLAGGRAEEPETVLLSRRLREFLDRCGRSELSPLEQAVVRSRLEGKSYEQVASELHCRLKSVDNALQRAKRKIWSYIGSGD